MTTANGTVATANASRYLQQLCKHWSHKFEVTFDEVHGHVSLPHGDVRLTADATTLRIALDAKPDRDPERLRAVVEEHLNRFAFREAPLPFVWSVA